METKKVTSTEFQTRTGQYLDEAGKAPVFITKHSRPVRVLIDIDLYEHFAELEKSTQEVLSASEATEDHLNVILNASPGAGSKAVSAKLGDESDLVL